MKKILASLLAAVTIALTLTATATAPSGDAGGGDGDRVLPPGSSVARDRRCHHCLPTARLCGVPRLRTTRLRTRVLPSTTLQAASSGIQVNRFCPGYVAPRPAGDVGPPPPAALPPK